MTRDEALAWCRDRDWYFSSYYKYRFTFTTAADGIHEATMSAGGDAGDIYRYDIGTGPMKFDDLLVGGWDIRIRRCGADLYEGDDQGDSG